MRIVALALLLAVAHPAPGQEVTTPRLEAAFIINFAKLATWPNLPPSDPIALCIVGDDEVASALSIGVQTQRAGAHALTVLRLAPDEEWTHCQVVFLGRAHAARLAKPTPFPLPGGVLTVSDDKDFAINGGMVEFFMDGSRLRFAINVKELHTSKVVLSSSVLQLARIVGDLHVR